MADAQVKESPVTKELMEDVIGRLFRAYDAHDPDKILALFTKDVVWEEPGIPSLRGHAAVKEHLRSVFEAMPDFHYTNKVFFISVDGKKGASHWHGVGKMTGRLDPPGYAATNKKLEFEGACFYSFRDGLIAKHTVIYDMLAIGRQIGALPREGSIGDKLAVRLQNVTVRNPLRAR